MRTECAELPAGAGFVQLSVDLRGARASTLDDAAAVEAIVRRHLLPDGADAALSLHRFEPQGLSCTLRAPGVLVVVHTWPEKRVATLDVWSRAVSSEDVARCAEALIAYEA